MEGINGAWLYPIILVAGALQAWGPPMNGAMRNSLTNPRLASLVSFLPIVALLGVLCLCLPRPLPTSEGLNGAPWWAPLGGIVGSFAVTAGLLFVDKVGAGALADLTITANILMSLAIDHFGWFGIPQHAVSPGRALGAALMVGGIYAISRFCGYDVTFVNLRSRAECGLPSGPLRRLDFAPIRSQEDLPDVEPAR
jgi:transporter family-2 protein